MWLIIKNEWTSLFRERSWFWINIGVALVLVAAVLLGRQQAEQQTERYRAAMDHLRAQWDGLDEKNPHGAAHYGTYVFKPATVLSSLDEGINSITGNVLRVEGHVQNEIVHSEASQSQTISKFGKLRGSLILQYLVPLLLIFLAFRSFSKEEQSGRMSLLLIQGAETTRLTLAKTISVWLYGVGLLSITILVYWAVNFSDLNADLFYRTVFLFCSYVLYYFILSALTIVLSLRWPRSNLALSSMLGIWIVWSIFLPNILMSTGEDMHELPSRDAFKTAMKEDRAEGIDGHNPSDKRSKALEEKVLSEYNVDSLAQLPINFDGLRMQADEDYGNQVWDKHFGSLREILARQKSTYSFGGFATPFISLQNASMGFAGSDNMHHQDFLLQAESYRRVLIKTLNDEHAFGGSKTGEWSWKADNAFYRSIDDFQYRALPFSTAFSHYALDLLILLGWSLLLVLLLVRGGKRYTHL